MTQYIPNDIEVRNVTLVNFKGNRIDIRNMMLEFNIYEDIYDAGMKCDIVVGDAIGLIERTPIVGDELLVISYKTPTYKKTRSLVFWIYSVKDRIKHKDRAYSYVLHGVVLETLNDLRKSIERSFKSLKISDMVRSVYNAKLKPSENDFSVVNSQISRLDIEATDRAQSFIAHNETSPIEFIRTLQKHAVSPNYLGSNYMFYQNIDGWHFRTLDSLLDGDVVDSFYFTGTDQEPDRDNKNLKNNNDLQDEPIRQYQKISFVNYESQFDNIDSYSSGLYNNQTEIIDPLRKKYEEEEFQYERDFSKINHLSQHKYYSPSSFHRNIEDGKVVNYLVGEIGENYKGLPYIKKAVGNDVRVSDPYGLPKSIRFKTASMSQLNNILIDIGIPGNSDIKIGDVIRIYLQQGSMEREYIGKNNLLFGQKDPRFLITAVRHTYNRENNQYTTILQCARDTYGITPREQDS